MLTIMFFFWNLIDTNIPNRKIFFYSKNITFFIVALEFTTVILLLRNNYYYKKRTKMVSKSVTILSFLLPISMVIGTSLAIFFYSYSSSTLLILSGIGGLILCAYIIILRSQHHRSAR